MTQVDFYIVGSDADGARLPIACRIAEKAVQLDQHVHICPASRAEARLLDELLWTFSPGSFVPHRIVEVPCDEAPAEPVLIGDGALAPGARWDLLINLSEEVPELYSRYARVAEVVDGEENRRARGRERYRFYRDQGCKLNTHRV